MNLTPPPRTATLFDAPDDLDLAAALVPPASVCIDTHCTDTTTGLPEAALLLRLSTATATRLDAADAFTTALVARFPHLTELMGDIRFAVQEAISNAVVHGNLGLHSAQRATLDDLRLFAEAMEQRLGDPNHARQPITIIARTTPHGIAISVEDRGAGFQLGAIATPLPAAAGGLGLTIIRKCCRRMRYSHGGRRITMLFHA